MVPKVPPQLTPSGFHDLPALINPDDYSRL
jgi:hypothetical protein